MNKNDNPRPNITGGNNPLNKYDKIYRVLPTYDEGKVRDIFNFIDKLDTNRILNYSVENNIPLSICENADGDNLIHAVLNLKMLELSEHIKLNFIKFLVQKDVNPDKPNKYNQTPLILACKYQLNSIISYLLSLGVNINYQDNMGYTPLHYLVIGNIKEIEENKQVLTFIPYNKSKKDIENIELLNNIKTIIYNYLTPSSANNLNNSTNPTNSTISSELTNKYVLTGGGADADADGGAGADADDGADANDAKEGTLELDELLKNIKGTIENIYNYNKANIPELDKELRPDIAKNKTLSDINKLFGINKNRYIENIQVHTNGINKKSSWRPNDINTGDTYLFKDYKIKSVVRGNVKSKLNELKQIVDNYNAMPYIDNNTEINNLFNIFYKNVLFDDDDEYEKKYTITNEFNNNYRNIYNINSDGDILDFENYQFFGGNNNVEVINNLVDYNKTVDGYDLVTIILNSINYYNYNNNGYHLLNILISTLITDSHGFDYKINITDINNLIAFSIFYLDEPFNFDYENIQYILKGDDNKFNFILDTITRQYSVITISNQNDINIDNLKKKINLWINYLLGNITFDEYTKDGNNTNYVDYFQDVNNINFIDTVCSQIIDKYDSLLYKPQLSVLLDTLFILNYYDNNKNTGNQDILNNMNTLLKLLNPLENINISTIITDKSNPLLKDTLTIHSNYGRIFLFINNDKDDITKKTHQNKFIFSKCLGLHYNGMLDKSIFTNNNNIYTSVEYLNASNEIVIDDKFCFNLPLDIGNGIENIENTLTNEGIVIPSHHSYVYTIINIINYCQLQMQQYIQNIYYDLNQLLGGYIARNIFNEIYTDYYPQILNFSNIISFYYDMLSNYLNKINKQLDETYKEYFNNILAYRHLTNKRIEELKNITDKVADLLNEINSYYFLYAYIYFNGKVNGFSYYRLPTSKNPSSFIYYYNAENVNKEENLKQINNTFKYEEQIGGTSIPYSRPDKYDKYDKYGVFGYSKFGNYKEILENYRKNIHEIIIKKEANEFNTTDNNNVLPQSIYDKLGLFYKYSVMAVLTRILNKKILEYNIDPKTSNPNTTTTTIENAIEKIFNLNIEDKTIKKLYVYENVCKIIQDIIYDYLIFYVNNRLENPNPEPKFNVTENIVKYELENEILEGLDKDNKLVIYNILKEIKSLSATATENSFILYPNDFSNTERTKTYYSIGVNKNNIDLLLRMGANPYLLNIENKTCIYNIINNYNYNLLNHLKERGIDYRTFDNDKPINYIIADMKTNLQKVLGDKFEFIAKNVPTKEILNNMTQLMYNKVVNSILSNNNFKNNVLILIEESFYMSSYLFINYLSKKLVYINDEFDIYDLNNICDLLDISENDVFAHNKGMIDKINNDDVESIYNKMINAKIEKNLEKIDIKSIELDKISLSLSEIKNEQIKKLLQDKSNELKSDINNLEEENKKLEKLNNSNINDIDKYMKIFDENINTNTDLIPLLMLIKQNILLRNSLTAYSVNQLNVLKKGFAIFSNISEYYFNTPKFTDDNYILLEIKKILKQTFELTIGYSTQLLIKKILLEYFLSQGDKPDTISGKIDLIINEEIINMLNNELFEELVKINAGIFDNNDDKITYILKSTDRILISLFDKILNNNILKNDESLKLVFYNNITPYLNTIISNCIKYWYVNIENIMKYFINNYRCLETLSSL